MTPSNPKPRYHVFVTAAAKRQIIALPREAQTRIDAQLLALGVNPRPPGVKKLKAQRDRYRVRTGDYRIIYEVSDEKLTVLVVTVGHRKDVYGR